MTKHTPLTRTCTACGIEKPITAFLYLTSKLGTTYGTICATCRGKGIKEKAQKFVAEEERTTTSSGMRIGVKQLLEIELAHKREKEELKSIREEELKKREQDSSEKIESIEEKAKAEKFHRETKQSFLNYQTKKTFGTQSVIGQKKDERFIQSSITNEKQRALEAANVTETLKQEELKTTLDLSSGSPVFDFHLSHDATLKRLQSSLSADSPLMKRLSRFYKDLQSGQEKDTPKEFVEKTWTRKR
jgi:hypothetical protein